MKLIHCSDIHLDSRMESNLSYQQAQERNRELCETFVRMIDYAKEHAVRAILLAGDLFDTDRITAKTADFLFAAMEQAREVDFLYLRGNHDESRRAFAGRKLPENLKTFSDRWTSYHYDTVTVTGLEFTRDNCMDYYDTLDLNPEETNLVLLHGQISTQSGQELIALPRLRGKHIDYLALGHLHSFQTGTLEDGATYCYCGCLEGRGFDECGEKGFVLLDVEDHAVRQTFVPFASRTLHDVPVDITGLTTVTQLREAMERSAEGIPSRDLVKFTLQGTYTLETQKDFPFLTQLLAHRFYFVKIKDESRLHVEVGSYEHDISLKGEFLRMVLGSDLSDKEKDQILLCGMEALSGEEVSL